MKTPVLPTHPELFDFESRTERLACVERTLDLSGVLVGRAVEVAIGSGDWHRAVVHDSEDFFRIKIDHRRQALDLTSPGIPHSSGLGAPDVTDASPALSLGSKVAGRTSAAIEKGGVVNSASLKRCEKVGVFQYLVDHRLVVVT